MLKPLDRSRLARILAAMHPYPRILYLVLALLLGLAPLRPLWAALQVGEPVMHTADTMVMDHGGDASCCPDATGTDVDGCAHGCPLCAACAGTVFDGGLSAPLILRTGFGSVATPPLPRWLAAVDLHPPSTTSFVY